MSFMNTLTNIYSNNSQLNVHAIEYLKEKLSLTFNKKLKQLILFGSYARGDNDVDSDVDLLLVISGELTKVEKEILTQIEIDVLTGFDLFVTILVETENYYERYRWLPFFQSVEKEGVNLYG